jgi:hypothetical protein
MKNKSLILVFAILVSLISSTVYSQNAYIKLGGGYGLSLASQIVSLTTTTSGTTTTYDTKYGSYGEGINFGLGFGYNINSNLALELAGSYILGKKFETNYTAATEKDYANTICIMPSVVVKAPLKDVTPYTRFGMILGIPTKFEELTATGFTGTRKYKETGGLAMGIQGAVGMNFKASKNVGIFAEIFGIGMNYAPSQKENTETYTELGLLDPTVTYNESGTYSTTSQPTPRYSFSSFGLNVGINLILGHVK